MKSKYEEKVQPRLKEIKDLVCKGMLEKDIFKFLGIGKTSWEKYKKEHKELEEVLKTAINETAPKMVEMLEKCALGFEYTEDVPIKKKRVFWKDGHKYEEEEVEVVKVTKFHPAQLEAMKFWLINKDKGNWALNPHNNDLKKEMNDLRKEMAEKQM